MRDIIGRAQVEPVRKRIAEATHALLGATIALSDEEWRQPSRLPGWSRAHVATHLARSADAMTRLTLDAAAGRPAVLYGSQRERRSELARGAERPGLELQIDLDTSADRLSEAFAAVTDWTPPVVLPVGELPLSAVVVARFHELALHHLDLDIGFSSDGGEPVQGSWLLQFAAMWARLRPGLPAVNLVSDSGVEEEVGDTGERLTVTGPDAALWAWLTGRSDGTDLDDTHGITWPLLG